MGNTENGLMKKTKKDLIDIILRKDNVERNLNNEIDKAKNQVAVITANYETCSKKGAKLASENLELSHKVKSLTRTNTGLMISTAIFAILYIIAIIF